MNYRLDIWLISSCLRDYQMPPNQNEWKTKSSWNGKGLRSNPKFYSVPLKWQKIWLKCENHISKFSYLLFNPERTTVQGQHLERILISSWPIKLYIPWRPSLKKFWQYKVSLIKSTYFRTCFNIFSFIFILNKASNNLTKRIPTR